MFQMCYVDEEPIEVPLAIKGGKILDCLTCADKFDRQIELILNRQGASPAR